MKVVADYKIPFLQGVLEPYADIVYYPGNEINNAVVKDADALIIRTRTICNSELLQGTSVKFIASATIGFDHIDRDYCDSNCIFWTNAPGCNSGSVMQYTASAILTWARENQINLEERVIGVIGVGNVGKKVVRMAENLGMQVLLNDPPRERLEGSCEFISLKGILREADIISLHVPLITEGDDKTYHMVNDDFLSKMNRGTLLINSSRGEVIDTQSLKRNLSKGSPEKVILDVWENEPRIDSELLKMSYLASPHIAGYSSDGKANGTTMAVRAFSRYFDLGIDDWETDTIPSPRFPVIACDGRNRSFQEIVTDLVLKTYSISEDSEKLKNAPALFEHFRGEYPIRREFFAYQLQTENIPADYLKRLSRLGFKIR
jgi:erythronate-4-phosphate dehydrogenase